MRPYRGRTAVLVTALVLVVLSGAAVPYLGGVASASHGYDEANYTVVPMSDRTPGAENVRYGQRVIADAGVNLETLEKMTATFEEGSWTECSPGDGEVWGIDRGNTLDGYEVDEDLQDNTKSFSAGEDVFQVEFYGEDDLGASTYFDDRDEMVSVAKCLDNPDKSGWYQITGSTTGVTEDGDRGTFESESHYFWICNCEDEDEARRELGPPPSEPQSTATPTPTPTATPGPGNGTPANETASGDGESAPSSTATPTATTATTDTTVTRTPTPTATAAGGTGDQDGSVGAQAGTPNEDWDEHVLETPTAAGGPGFGPAAALVAVLGAVLLLRRRP